MRYLMCAVAAAVVAAASLAAVPALAQEQAATSQAPDYRSIVGEVRRIIAERYVLPERRAPLDAVLAEGLASGRYAVSDPAELAVRVNADLERVGQDRHLNFHFDPQRATILGLPSAAEEDFDVAAYEAEVRRDHHGISELRLLPGNVRYMRYDGFAWIGEDSQQAIDDAMRFLGGGDAVIIDLRRNGGGSPDAVRQIISYFLPAGTPLVTFYMQGEAEPNGTESLAELAAPRVVGKPLYVLISGRTGSAAEEFSGHVSGYRIGELVGATTAGAGFRNEVLAIDGQYLLSVSVGRAVLASTGRDWEAVGIAPTMEVPVAGALELAQAAAMDHLATTATGEDREPLLAHRDALRAYAEPPAAARPLADYAGHYGERVIEYADGRLTYRRGQGMPEVLVPLGGDSFVWRSDPDLRIAFVAAADGVTAMRLGPAVGPAQGTYQRTAD